MDNLKNSSLLNEILQQAEILINENHCSGLSRDYIVIAAIRVIDQKEKDGSSEPSEEYKETLQLLRQYSRDPEALNEVLKNWQGKDIPTNEKVILSLNKSRAIETAKALMRSELTADFFLKEILKQESDAVRRLRFPGRSDAAPKQNEDDPHEETSAEESALLKLIRRKKEESRQEENAEKEEKAVKAEITEPAGNISSIIAEAKDLQNKLLNTVYGQDQAVNVFVEGFFQAELRSAIEKDRKKPRATFLFAGSPGVGKTFLAESSAEILGLAFKRFDMSEYNTPTAVEELCGFQQNYKASGEGLLTSFVNKNPKCLLLFDEIEKASHEVIHLFLQILDGGRLRDYRTVKEVSFTDTIIIFTTNAGRSLYENETAKNLSALPRDVIIDSLANEIDPKTKEPFFPTAICSRFAAGNVVMFNHLDGNTLWKIVNKKLEKNRKNLQDSLDIRVSYDNQLPTAILLSAGASADARKAESRADSYFSSELYELYRLTSSEKVGGQVENIRDIHFLVDTENAPDEIRNLFIPSERLHVLVYSDENLSTDPEDDMAPVFHHVHTMEEAKRVIDLEHIQLVFFDLYTEMEENDSPFLNTEDIVSSSRNFLHDMLTYYPDIPIVLIEKPGKTFSREEKISYLRRGVYGFISASTDEFSKQTERISERIFQQNNMLKLARSNQLISFETAQTVDKEGSSAEVILFDMKLEKAIKSEDSGNILSLLSTPDVHFEDIIGAEDAKDELKFFIQYMQDPKKYNKQGASAPRGIILYGPPGTGKTMLAKAFAAESNATFIAVEGNQFFKKYIGEGAEMVHRIFATAKRYAPTVIFIDEIDTIAKARTGRDTDAGNDSEQILTALFAEMDGFSTDPGRPVFVLGATNYSVDSDSSMHLDPAFLRRFDRRILIDLPGKENKKLFLKKKTDAKPIFALTDRSIQSIAERSHGMSLAHLNSFLDMAIRSAIRANKESINDEDFEDAFDKFNSGEEKKWSDEIVLRTARHEAGHTLISWLSGEKPAYVTIVSRGNYGGYMQHEDREDQFGFTRQELLSRIRTSLGGRASEILYYGTEDGISTGASGDLRTATDLALKMLCSFGMNQDFGLAVFDTNDESLKYKLKDDINKVLEEQLEYAVQLLTDHKTVLDALVENLIARTNLRGTDIDKICSDMIKSR